MGYKCDCQRPDDQSGLVRCMRLDITNYIANLSTVRNAI